METIDARSHLFDGGPLDLITRYSDQIVTAADTFQSTRPLPGYLADLAYGLNTAFATAVAAEPCLILKDWRCLHSITRLSPLSADFTNCAASVVKRSGGSVASWESGGSGHASWSSKSTTGARE